MTTPAVVETKQDIAPVQQAASLMQIIERVAMSPDVDTGKLKDMLDMYERIEAKRAEAEFNTAMAEMQSEMPVITEHGKIVVNKDVRSTYARFEDINDAVKPVLQKHGFAVSFRTETASGKVNVMGILMHRGGHREETTMTLDADTSGSKNGVQAMGSSLSYAKRYTMCALLNITTRGEDDDGEGAGKFITESQVGYINQLLTDTGSDVKRFLKHVQAQEVKRIRADQYGNVVKVLEQKKAKLAKEQANA